MNLKSRAIAACAAACLTLALTACGGGEVATVQPVFTPQAAARESSTSAHAQAQQPIVFRACCDGGNSSAAEAAANNAATTDASR